METIVDQFIVDMGLLLRSSPRLDSRALVAFVREYEGLIRIHVTHFLVVNTPFVWQLGFYLGTAHMVYCMLCRMRRIQVVPINTDIEFVGEIPSQSASSLSQ